LIIVLLLLLYSDGEGRYRLYLAVSLSVIVLMMICVILFWCCCWYCYHCSDDAIVIVVVLGILFCSLNDYPFVVVIVEELWCRWCISVVDEYLVVDLRKLRWHCLTVLWLLPFGMMMHCGSRGSVDAIIDIFMFWWWWWMSSDDVMPCSWWCCSHCWYLSVRYAVMMPCCLFVMWCVPFRVLESGEILCWCCWLCRVERSGRLFPYVVPCRYIILTVCWWYCWYRCPFWCEASDIATTDYCWFVLMMLGGDIVTMLTDIPMMIMFVCILLLLTWKCPITMSLKYIDYLHWYHWYYIVILPLHFNEVIYITIVCYYSRR